MKWLWLVSFLLLFLMGVAALAAPRIGSDSLIYNFEVPVGVVVSHTFTLTNLGDEVLTITNVKAACGCTTTSLPKSNLAPGESVGLEVALDTRGYTGSVIKSVEVSSNDPTTPSLVLRLAGLVKAMKPGFHIAVSELDRLFYLLVDLREPERYAVAHLLGAINIPYAELGTWIGRLPHGVSLILYDEKGTLSDQAVQTLQAEGFPDARSLLGGFEEWTRVYDEKFTFPF